MEEVVEVDPAVNRGPHHAPQVCSLEVGAHYFIKFAVTQHLKKYTIIRCIQNIRKLSLTEMTDSICIYIIANKKNCLVYKEDD